VYDLHSPQTQSNFENNGPSDVLNYSQEVYDPLSLADLKITRDINFDIAYKNLIIGDSVKSLIPQQFIKSINQEQSVTDKL
jgi:hypothetical protein